MQSLIDIYEHEGWMPDGRVGNYNGRTQGGSDADFVLADGYVKGLKVDWEEGYNALVKDTERTPWDQSKEGRGDRQLGFRYWHVHA